ISDNSDRIGKALIIFVGSNRGRIGKAMHAEYSLAKSGEKAFSSPKLLSVRIAMMYRLTLSFKNEIVREDALTVLH
ncbi:hypothetical protein L218DRAFT_861144, partial [Marasmius fiardii PR-910]